MELEVNKRLKEFIEVKKISQEEIRKSVGLRSRAQVSNWFTFLDKVPDKHLIKILQSYPELNANWILNDTGQMLNDKSEISMKSKGEYGFCEECIKKDAKIEYIEKAIIDKDEKLSNLSQKVGELISKLEDCNERLSNNGQFKANAG